MNYRTALELAALEVPVLTGIIITVRGCVEVEVALLEAVEVLTGAMIIELVAPGRTIGLVLVAFGIASFTLANCSLN